MAIRLDDERYDAQGLPVVIWEEDRNMFAPEGTGCARVACFIRPDEKTGALLFVKAGPSRHGAYEEARPWDRLASFGRETAENLYASAQDRVALDVLASKSKSGVGRLLATDSSQVVLANFSDERPSSPMHLNCADALPVEVAMLHDRLHRQFIARRPELLREKCGDEAVWPKGKAFSAFEPPAPAVLPRWKARLVDLSIAVALGLIGWWLYNLLLR
jgi:hypothetical protein